MTRLDVVRFQFGHRGAIEQIAASRLAIPVGLVLVATAGIARNYDHHLLYLEPQWIAGPVGVSFFSSIFVLWGMVVMAGTRKKFWAQWCSFLGLFWMTAPLAWIYAIPVERYCDLRAATWYNLCFLIVVSLWRVALMARVCQVLLKVRFAHALVAVMGPASIEFCAASFLHQINQEMSIVAIMGGLSPGEDGQFLMNLSGMVSGIAFWVMILSVLLGTRVWIRHRKTGERFRFPALKPERRSPAGVLTLSAVLLGWAAASIPAQRELAPLRKSEWAFMQGDFAKGLGILAAHEREELSPAYPIPPNLTYSRHAWEAPKIFLELRPDHPEWLRQAYFDKVVNVTARITMVWAIDKSYFEMLIHLAAFPEGPEWAKRHRDVWIGFFSLKDSRDELAELRNRAMTALGITGDDLILGRGPAPGPDEP